MAYSTGSTILDDDYNGFATEVNWIWGSTSAVDTQGYGQPTTVSPVAAGNTVTATQWTTLLARISSSASHQGTSITAIANPSVGNTISVFSALSGNITNIINGRLNASASGADSTTTNSTTSAWGGSASITKTITFSSSNAAKYFFNAGGMIRISLSRSGGTAQPKNTAWTNLLNAVGTLVWTGYATSKTIAGTSYAGLTKIGGSGSTTTFSNVGVREMGASTLRFRQFDATYLYTANYVDVSCAWSGTVFTMAIVLTDADTDPQNVDGTLSLSTTIRPPSTTYLSSTWGTPAANTPTWTLT